MLADRAEQLGRPTRSAPLRPGGTEGSGTRGRRHSARPKPPRRRLLTGLGSGGDGHRGRRRFRVADGDGQAGDSEAVVHLADRVGERPVVGEVHERADERVEHPHPSREQQRKAENLLPRHAGSRAGAGSRLVPGAMMGPRPSGTWGPTPASDPALSAAPPGSVREHLARWSWRLLCLRRCYRRVICGGRE